MLTQSPADILKRIRKIEIHTKSLVNEIFGGEYHSMFKGQGLEFSEVREYMPGDNYRDIDWNVSARLGMPYIKKYRETRELNVFFIIDCSASHNFGTRVMLKKELMAEISAVLSFSALSNNDKVGMIMFSDQPEKYLPPRKGRNHTLEILRDILYLEPRSTRTSLFSAFEYANRILKKRSIVFVLSDFLDSGYEQPFRHLARKHDVIAIRIYDAAEMALPEAGILNLCDPETGEYFMVNTSSHQLRQHYQQMMKRREAALNSLVQQSQSDLLTIRADEPYILTLRNFFERRRKKYRRHR